MPSRVAALAGGWRRRERGALTRQDRQRGRVSFTEPNAFPWRVTLAELEPPIWHLVVPW
jgi:hypothetical protein